MARKRDQRDGHDPRAADVATTRDATTGADGTAAAAPYRFVWRCSSESKRARSPHDESERDDENAD